MAASSCSGGWTNEAKYTKEVPKDTMKQRIRKIPKLLVLPLLIAVLLFQTQAFAADYSCTVTIPVEVQVTGNSKSSGIDTTIRMTPKNPSNPMPDEDTLVLTDSDQGEFGPITYTRPGNYLYTVTQVKGSEKYVTYDATSYTVTVRVINDEKGGLASEIWATVPGKEGKLDQILFTNTVQQPSKPVVVPTSSTTKTIINTTATTSPKTGDGTNLAVLSGLMGISLLGLIGMTVVSLWSKKRS